MKSEKDRRHVQREMCSDFGQIAWLDQRGRRISCLGLIEDVSPDGLCLNLELPGPASATVHLHTKGFEGEARVCYCELGDSGYLIGLEFVNGCAWDRNKWRPRHLLSATG